MQHTEPIQHLHLTEAAESTHTGAGCGSCKCKLVLVARRPRRVTFCVCDVRENEVVCSSHPSFHSGPAITGAVRPLKESFCPRP